MTQRLVEAQNVVNGQYSGSFPAGLLPLDTMLFDAFGEKRADIDASTSGPESAAYNYQDPFGYGAQWGYYTDPETGFVQMTHRYYDPFTARFLTRDPIGYNGGLNLYGFVGNNPITRMDPEGTSGTGNWFERWWHSIWHHQTSVTMNPGTPTLGNALAGNRATLNELESGDDDGNIADVKAYDTAVGRMGPGVSNGLNQAGAALVNSAATVGVPEVREGEAVEGAVAAVRAAKTGRIVLGKWPTYLEVGENIGAKTLNIPTEIWDRLSEAQKWSINRQFLYRAIKRGDEIHLATPPGLAKPGTFYYRELRYLESHGYRPSADGTRMIR